MLKGTQALLHAIETGQPEPTNAKQAAELAKHTPGPFVVKPVTGGPLGDMYEVSGPGKYSTTCGGPNAKKSAEIKAAELNRVFKLGQQDADKEMLLTLKAIRARRAGRFDDPSLVAMGPLRIDEPAQTLEWITAAIAKATGGAA